MEFRIDCSGIETRPQLHRALAEILNFPQWYGHNLDALHDVLTARSSPTRLVLENWDCFAPLGQGFRRVLEDSAAENPQFLVFFR